MDANEQLKMKASIIIRCKNEEDWIGHCLESVFAQTYENFEVIIVDNDSTDNTLRIVEEYPVKKIVHIEKYLPGLSINQGIRESSGEVIVILSAHCIPKDEDWLFTLVSNFQSPEIAGVYGRQLPTSYSSPYDVRDLLITFGLDKRIQKKDYFFHNANSAILRSVWDKVPFDEQATNIEDRIWAKEVTKMGFHLIYEPNAAAFHHHGIHQTQNIERARTTLEVLKDVEEINDLDWMPESLKPENRNIIALIPIKEKLENIGSFSPVKNLIETLLIEDNLKAIYLLSKDDIVGDYIDNEKVFLLERPEELDHEAIAFTEVLRWGLEQINNDKVYPNYVIYINPEYTFRPENLIDRLIKDVCFKGLDTVFVGYEEYANHWNYSSDSRDYQPVNSDLRSRADKRPVFKSLLGLGLITRSNLIRKGLIISEENVGVISTNNFKHTLRVSDPTMKPLISKLL
jgi:rhamnosyltransferase